MLLKLIITLCLLLSLSLFSINRKSDFNCLVLTGIGLKINQDTIFLGKSTPIDICKYLKIKDHFETVIVESGNGTVAYKKFVNYKGAYFFFYGDFEEHLLLDRVVIDYGNSFKVYVNDSIWLGQLNPPIEKYFNLIKGRDSITPNKLKYFLDSNGIIFELDSVKMKRKLVTIYIDRIEN